jgi:hypothetical protein
VERLKEVEGLTMSFRAIDKVAGLLRTLSMHLTCSLVKLDMVRTGGRGYGGKGG